METDLNNMTKEMPYSESEEYVERLIERCSDTAIAKRKYPRRSWGTIAACAAAAAVVIIAIGLAWKSATTMEQAENAIEVATLAIDEASATIDEATSAPPSPPPAIASAKPPTGAAAQSSDTGSEEAAEESPLDEFLDNITDAEAQALMCFVVDEEPVNIN